MFSPRDLDKEASTRCLLTRFKASPPASLKASSRGRQAQRGTIYGLLPRSGFSDTWRPLQDVVLKRQRQICPPEADFQPLVEISAKVRDFLPVTTRTTCLVLAEVSFNKFTTFFEKGKSDAKIIFTPLEEKYLWGW